jgi:hypothetical protein
MKIHKKQKSFISLAPDLFQFLIFEGKEKKVIKSSVAEDCWTFSLAKHRSN